MNKAKLLNNAFPLGGSLEVAAVLGWSAYRNGLFFDSDLYRLEGLLFIGLLCWLVFRLAIRREANIPPWVILPFGLSVVYALELWIGPVSVKGTMDSMLRWMTYCCWSLLLWGLWRKRMSRSWGFAAIQASGLFLLAGGWAGWFGWTSFADIVLRFDDAELSATGARLAGYLQYPNAYGAVLAAFLLMQLLALAGARKHRGYAQRFAAATVVPYGGALLLTESRGAIAALLLAFGLAIIVLDRAGRRRLLIGSGISAVGSALMARAAWNWMQEASAAGAEARQSLIGSVNFWAAVICELAGMILLIGLSRVWIRESNRDSNKQVPLIGTGGKVIPWLIAGVGAAAAYRITFSHAGERIAGHYGTVTSRKLFYADAWEIFKDSPWFGYGGESWRMLFGLYQRQPYVGNEVHSGYLEILLDTGVIGFAFLVFMLGIYIAKMWGYQRAAVAPAAVLLVHAAIDFDWSYAFVWLLLIAWFMLHIAPTEEMEAAKEGVKAQEGTAGENNAWLKLGDAGLAVLLIGCTAIGLWAAWRADTAAQARADAVSAAAPAARIALLRAALEANPAWSRIRLELAPLLPLRERADLLEAGLRYEPQATPLLLQLGIAYAELGDVAQAAARLREALRLERFSRNGYNAAIASMANLAEMRRMDGDSGQATEAAEAAVSMFKQFQALDRQVSDMHNPANGKQFRMTVAAKLHAAQCLVILSRTEEARFLLLEVVEEGDEDWKEQAQEILGRITP